MFVGALKPLRHFDYLLGLQMVLGMVCNSSRRSRVPLHVHVSLSALH